MPCPPAQHHHNHGDAAKQQHGLRHHHQHGLNGALILTALFALVELVAGLMADSLALLADAGHMVSDIAALSLAVMAGHIAARPAHAGMSYGYGRARVLAAQANGLGLWFLCGWISWEAFGRLSETHIVDGGIVLGVAFLGLLVNLISLFLLKDHHDLNSRAAYWHVLGDALGSIAAMLAGLIIVLTGWYPIDPLLSFLVAGILAWSGWKLLRETTLLLMEGSPESIDIVDLHQGIENLEHVDGLHHVHLWTLPDGTLAMSAHVEVCDMTRWPDLLPEIQRQLKVQGIRHATLQPELKNCGD
ncbi:MAG: cation diffusion facilitator family transporter [Mariprofundaceae bacterium]